MNQKTFSITFHLKLSLNVILNISKLLLKSTPESPRINTIPLPLTTSPHYTTSVLVVYFPLTGQFTFASTVAKPGLLHHTPHPSTSSTTPFNTLAWKPILPALTTTLFLALFFNFTPIYTIFASFHFLISCFQEFLLFMEQDESLISKV